MEDVFARPAFWLATTAPLFATVAIVLLTRSVRPVLRTVLVGITYFGSLPVGFVLVLSAIDRGPELRRAVDGLATIPMLAVWLITAVVVGGALWLAAILKKR